MTTNASGRLLMVIEGAPPMSARNRPAALLSSVSEDYATAIGMRVVSGRWITNSEQAPTCVINAQLAARDFPGEDPIGQRLQIAGPLSATGPNVTFATIVGVVADLRYGDLETPPEPEIFADYRHTSPFAMTFVARLSGNPRSAARDIREVIASVDRFQSVSEVKTLASVLDDSMAARRFNIFLFGIFSGTALLLAMIGVYGVLAYSAALQTREIGIRMAFGAERADVLRLILRRASVIVSVGLLGGMTSALGITRLMVGLLYGVTPTDPLTFATVILVVTGTSLAACALPAWRAANLNPAAALRAE
jgi:predicted permease